MSKDILKEQLSGIETIGKELALRFALFSHTRQADHRLEMLAELHKLDCQLTEARDAAKAAAAYSVAEERCITRVRALEDQRFQLLSEINGENISQYTP